MIARLLRRRLRRIRAPATAGPYAEIESVAQRAAALLRGGVPAARVWRLLVAEPGDARAGPGTVEAGPGGAIDLVVRRLDAGATSAEALSALDAPQWRALAATWRIAELSGAPLARSLDRFAGAMRALGRVAERRGVVLAGPRATVRLVTALPPLALLMGAALGFDPLAALAEPAGLAAAALGAVLLVAGERWATALTARIERADWIAGWEFELAAIALDGGAPLQAALRRVADCADEAGAAWVRLGELGREGAVSRAVEAASAQGAPLGPMLRSEAERRRDLAQADLERAAERLGVLVLVPLGVCVLPAFVLLGVVPVLLAVLGG